ncbi:solute carrier family 66 member 3 [Hylaeus anthracinus]|uniref:solute carrier family 66 member 3 n=1 Tax=Hylaeus anthracinus TaxID=313031 RepID=UPI0023B90368|nr:solute carrier family 66 member 3 [Hylaeus anthracinus]XP_054012788.1 solute carrier family 66 member 3 [Hylaeus anthracinus]XP_054012789.1 solute carrier family 66 member 3 [Hylaeus anthracinus]XP_054012790.1 solute carrier family 66 member 3 [Hylaeus anthracinus]XP_054012792.1 solute carrier family 66 member 3 [Hylaeus anthracinus]XP_054012793.1 solute carrier family 66 member 3 [Hylaeus anthracinus]XP_054012794.1 solute carrier family 66 member 3 [Hylaeus anthracinus]XP_054012795.1 sol
MSLQQFADLLSLITIGMCFVLKIPQILNLYNAKSAKGISIASLLLELVSYTVMTSYNYTNGYSFLSYMEYPVILFQEYIMFFLVLKYLNKINLVAALSAVLYFTITICFALRVIPAGVLTFLASLCTPISMSSKVIQLLAIVRAKNADAVSPITWFISAFTNLTRVFTIWLDSADILLLGNFTISVLLSSSIMFAAIYYRWHRIKQD